MATGVIAVIPTFRPPPDLVDAVIRLQHMVDAILVVDDSSPCTFDPLLRAAGHHARVHHFPNNAGIARSLNLGLAQAREQNFPWLLTLDQDSCPDTDLVTHLLATASEAQERGVIPGVVAPEIINDASGALRYPHRLECGMITTHEVFQSGALWNVERLLAAGGFDESLGIDAVDSAACLALRRSGAKVLLSSTAAIEHNWGSTRQFSLFGRPIAVTNHSPERRTTMVRNRLRLAPAEFRQSPVHALRTLRRITMSSLLAVTVEDDRWAKAKATLRGIGRSTER